MPPYSRTLMPKPGWVAAIARAWAMAWSMALFSTIGPPSVGWMSLQLTFTTKPRTAAPAYSAGGGPWRSSRPASTGFNDDAGGWGKIDVGGVRVTSGEAMSAQA